MTGIFILDWANQTVSLFNVMILVWLGLVVLLNAERRTPGLWIAGAQLLLGALFFISHSVLLANGFSSGNNVLNIWWWLGLVPVAILPYAWYAMMLWYHGYWDRRHSSLRKRHRVWFAPLTLFALTTLLFLFLANPFPSFIQVIQRQKASSPNVFGLPLLAVVYPPYILACLIVAIDVIRKPGPAARMMGKLGRRRARPWLISATVVQIMVSLVVSSAIYWYLQSSDQVPITAAGWNTIAIFDLIIALQIGAAILLVGQAIVSYEVFTGKSLPRQRLLRFWRSAYLLAGGSALILGWTLIAGSPAVFTVTLTALLASTLYALISRQAYNERENFIQRLRPFVSSQTLYSQLLETNPVYKQWEMSKPFQALCVDILGAERGYLIPLGPLAPLAGPPTAYPDQHVPFSPSTIEIIFQSGSPQTLCIPIDPQELDGVAWGIPLWSQQGLIGALLLGEKTNGSLYTHEEMELARAIGEQLIDSQASSEIARRLMELQRQRLAESQVLDQQTRRSLHDDVLPQLHTAMLALSQAPDRTQDVLQMLGAIHHQLADILRQMPKTTAPEISRYGLVGALKQAVAELGNAFDGLEWNISSPGEEQAAALPPLAAEVLYYAAREAIRNAARHGRDEAKDAPFKLRITILFYANRQTLELAIEDNGIGIAASPENISKGQGLALHSTLMAVIGGSLTVESIPHTRTCVALRLPLNKRKGY